MQEVRVDYPRRTSAVADLGGTQYWQSDDESSEKFWEHEWDKHGTCYTTLAPDCFSDYQTGEDVRTLRCILSGPVMDNIIRQAVTFFETAVALFKQLPTYDWLSQAGITPDSSKTYTLDELQSAIQSAASVRLPCTCPDDHKR